jgi:NAD(P)-dependent dehydrogenase (short-subunit alcohol dehydrogenase family)
MTNDNCCVIFGATGGLGGSLSRALAGKIDQKIILVGRNILNDSHITYSCDNRNLAEINSTLDDIEKVHGKIVSAIDLTGAIQISLFEKLESADFESLISTNIIGPMNMAKAFMARSNDEIVVRLIFLSSVLVENSVVGANVYASTKGAVETFVKASAKELFRHNIVINAIRLGYFDAGMINKVPSSVLAQAISRTSVERLGNTNDLAPLIKFLIRDATDYLTGTTIALTGGD